MPADVSLPTYRLVTVPTELYQLMLRSIHVLSLFRNVYRMK